MMKINCGFTRLLLIAVAAWALSFSAFAEPGREDLRERLGRMSPEERQQMRQQMREHWQQVPPEQREQRRQDLRDTWRQSPPEDRQRLRDERGQQHGGRFSGSGRGPNGGGPGWRR